MLPGGIFFSIHLNFIGPHVRGSLSSFLRCDLWEGMIKNETISYLSKRNGKETTLTPPKILFTYLASNFQQTTNFLTKQRDQQTNTRQTLKTKQSNGKQWDRLREKSYRCAFARGGGPRLFEAPPFTPPGQSASGLLDFPPSISCERESGSVPSQKI